MTPDEIRALIRRLVDAHNRHDPEAATACFTPDITNHGRPAGRDGMAAIYRSLYQAFPDFHFEIEQLLIDGAWATAVYRMTGTHTGTPELPVLGGLLVDVPPTGQRVEVLNIHVYRLEGGLIAEHRAVRDDLGMMQQLGLLPTTPHPAGDISRPARRESAAHPLPNEVQVRPFRSSDTDAVVELWHRCGLVVPGNNPQQDIARKQQVQPDLFLVAELRGQVIGTVMAGYEGHRGWVNYVAVTPECQRGGVGRLLMERAESALRDLGCPKLNLQIRLTNTGVVAFYERLGYAVEDRVSMGKRLAVVSTRDRRVQHPHHPGDQPPRE
jgi:ribosomal protein S18 acetylase RimI-like enzyme/predicted ester cyclase